MVRNAIIFVSIDWKLFLRKLFKSFFLCLQYIYVNNEPVSMKNV